MADAPVILDQHGVPYPVAPTVGGGPPPILTELSAEGREQVFNAFVDELLRECDEVLNAHGNGDLKLYEKIFGDDQVQPCFRQRRSSVVARELKIEPGGSSQIDTDAADDLRAQIDALSWDRITYRMLGGVIYGRSHAECMFRQDGLHIILDGVRVRKPRRFKFNTAKQLVLIDGVEREVMPDRKFWTCTFGAEDDDSPYGVGLGSFLYWPVWFKRNAIRWWAIFLETTASPTAKAEVPPGMKKTEQDEILAKLDAIRNGGRLVVPRGTIVSFLEAVRNSGGDYSAFVDRMDRTITKLTLLQTMTTDAATTGLGSTQGEVQERVGDIGAQTDSDLLTESFMRGPATWLTEWNYPGAKTPKMFRDFARKSDMKAEADRDAVLVNIGYRPTAERVKEVYGDGYEPIAAPPAADPSAGLAPAFAENAAPTTDPSKGAVDRLVENDGWRRAMGPMVDQIESMLNDEASLQKVRDRLGDLALSDPRDLAEELARLTFAGRLQGATGAEDDHDS